MEEKINLFIAALIREHDEFWELVYPDELEYYYEQWKDKPLGGAEDDEEVDFEYFGNDATNEDWLCFFKSFSDSEILADVDSISDFQRVDGEVWDYDTYKGWEQHRVVFRTKTKFWEFFIYEGSRVMFGDNEFEMNEVFPREETITTTKTVYETKAQLSQNK
jgi:hypothetical protein